MDVQLTGQNGQVSTFTTAFEGGGFLGSFLIVDGSDLDANTIYFSHAGMNPNGNDYVKMLGNNAFGFEDMAGLGDRDYNDVVVEFSIL